MKIELLDSAEKDLLDGFEFYERKSKGLGGYFLESLFSDIDSLYIFAGVHALHFGYHRLLSKRFPFAIYYKVNIETVQVYAILDCRRNPAWIRKKLT
ncbi:MAG: type II toxin-antitoxin system RelE/ParE family toxin [Candidatus Schekmanbacteria bacterium]|nr:type II toxin-antitoxin system RelE/ParE family toxin [Candidatus Schekmanbacteria bacterium]